MKQQETKVVEFSRLIALTTSFCALAPLLLLLWTAGCGPHVQAPISAIAANLDVADFCSVMEIIDVSNPAKPVKVSSISLPSKPEYYSSIAVWKQYVLATTAYGVHLLDAANPSAPKLLWNLPLDIISGKFAVFKDYVFFPTQKGLFVLYLKNPFDPQWVFYTGHKENPDSHLLDLKIKGNYAYTHDVHNYLHVLNLSQPQQPRLEDSHTIKSPSSFLLVRTVGDEVSLQPAKIDVDPLYDTRSISRIDFVVRWGLGQPQRELTPDMSHQLSDWSNLLQLGTGFGVKAQMTPQFLCWAHLYDDDPQLWLLPPNTSRIFPLDIAPAHIKHQYNLGMKKPPEAGNVTDVIRGPRDKDSFHLISQDNWMKTVKIDRDEGGRISDFQLSGNLIYLLREGGVLFIAELSTTEGLRGLGLLENLSQPSQCLTLDENFLYILGSKPSSEAEGMPQKNPPTSMRRY